MRQQVADGGAWRAGGGVEVDDALAAITICEAPPWICSGLGSIAVCGVSG